MVLQWQPLPVPAFFLLFNDHFLSFTLTTFVPASCCYTDHYSWVGSTSWLLLFVLVCYLLSCFSASLLIGLHDGRDMSATTPQPSAGGHRPYVSAGH